MKVKLIQQGWETYTGDLGTVEFVNGQTVDSISAGEARALGAYVHIVEIDDDGNHLGQVNPAHDIVKISEVSAPSPRVLRTLKEIQEEAAAAAGEDGEEADRSGPYTRDELEAVASEKGIAGLRKIAEPLGIKGTSIRLLVEEILVKQPNGAPTLVTPEAPVVEEEAPVEETEE